MTTGESVKWKNYGEWIGQIPNWVSSDPLWEFHVYRKALFLSDLAYQDCELLFKHNHGKHLVSQLLRSASSVSANIEEGYGRGYGKDYARFLRIAHGSARETRGWYYRLRDVFPAEVIEFRIALITEIIKLLTTTANQQRKYKATSN